MNWFRGRSGGTKDLMKWGAPDLAVKYITELRGAHEITLIATADLDFWKEHLKPADLYPHNANGRAELVLSAVKSRWLGVKFSELSLSVVVSHHEDGSSRDGVYLLSAYNSSRLLAFFERKLFQTPYVHGRIEVGATPLVSFRLLDGAQSVLHTESADTSVPSLQDEVWELAIYLPKRRAPTDERGNLFYARLGGRTEVRPFSSSADVLKVRPSERDVALQWLLDSGVAGNEWHVRRQAAHARSKTYQRTV